MYPTWHAATSGTKQSLFFDYESPKGCHRSSKIAHRNSTVLCSGPIELGNPMHKSVTMTDRSRLNYITA